MRSFFLEEGGLATLGSSTVNPFGGTHLSILRTLLQYELLEDVSVIFSRLAEFSEMRDLQVDESEQLDRPMRVGSSASSSTTLRSRLGHISQRPLSNKELSDRKYWEKFIHDEDEHHKLPYYQLKATQEYVNSQRRLASSSPVTSITGESEPDARSSISSYRISEDEVQPHLHQYAYDMLLIHARAADTIGALPDTARDFLLAKKWRASIFTRYEMRYGATLLPFAARWDLVTWLECLILRKGHHVNEIGGQGHTPLSVAAIHGNVRAMSFLLNIGAHLIPDRHGRTALHHIAARGDASLVDESWALARKSSVLRGKIRRSIWRRDHDGLTPTDIAINNMNLYVVSRLESFVTEYTTDTTDTTETIVSSRDPFELSTVDLLDDILS